MSAKLQTLEQLDETPVILEPPRRRAREPIRQVVKTTPGGADKHTHCAIYFGDDGDGFTSPGPDGHVHKVIALELERILGHTHDLSASRCLERHDHATGRHVQARR